MNASGPSAFRDLWARVMFLMFYRQVQFEKLSKHYE